MFNIQLRMLPTLIRKNGANSVWKTHHKKTKLYFLTLVIEDKNNQLNGSVCLESFNGIGNNDYLDVYRTLYNSNGFSQADMPERLFFISSIIRCKREINAPSTVFYNLRKDKEYKELSNTLSSMVSETVTFPFIVNIALKFFEVIKRYLGRIDYNSLATITDYFSKKMGDLDEPGKFRLNKATLNVDFNFELIVQHKNLFLDMDDTVSPSFNSMFSNSCFQSIEIN